MANSVDVVFSFDTTGSMYPGYFPSPITGGNGNTEFSLWARHPAAPATT